MTSARFGLVVAVVSIATLTLPGTRAGGLMDDDHDHPPGADAGPAYHGFVKDTRGVVIPEARVVAEIKSRGSIVTYSNILGAYRLNSFGTEIKPEDVTIGCSKPGYKQVRVNRRQENIDGKGAIEIECILQRT